MTADPEEYLEELTPTVLPIIVPEEALVYVESTGTTTVEEETE